MTASREPAVPPGWAWGLVAAFAVHNLEEAVMMPAFLEGGAGGLGLGPAALPPFLVAVAAVTAVAVALGLAASTVPQRRWVRPGLRLLAVIMVVNVVVPHVPAAVISGGYVPGLVTALGLNLPVAGAFLRRTRPWRGPDPVTA